MGISAQQFEQMQKRVSGKASPAPAFAPSITREKSGALILGIDPSLRGTGYGIVRMDGATARAVVFGTVSLSSSALRSACLARILETFRTLIQEHHPTACAVEGLFYAQNYQTALIMGEARGAALAAVAEAGIEIFELAPRKVKQAIVGYGAAQKHAVGKMIQRMLHLTTLPSPDAADALAVALALGNERRSINLAPPKRL